MIEIYNTFLYSMIAIAIIVFIALFFITAGYGKFTTKSWGLSINNKIGWIIMESPVFIAMCLLCILSTKEITISMWVIFILFQLHYFNRSFIFPFKLKGKSKMPLSVISMGVIFNLLNGLMQGGWLFFFAPDNLYSNNYLTSPQFIIGSIIFLIGMYINIQSDHIIRNLRKPDDSNHYLPKGGLYNYVTSANYFGEITEWIGYAILTWSLAGAVFAIWTFANLVPRAASIYKRYSIEFKEEMQGKNLKRVIPWIY